MSEPNKCVDCGFELDYSDEDIPQCFRCDSQEWQRMYRKGQANLDKAMDYINDLADNGFETARALKKEIEGMK